MMSSIKHRVLFSIPNPFRKRFPHQATGPKLLWLTRDEIAAGQQASPGNEYLLIIYGWRGNVKHIIRWQSLKAPSNASYAPCAATSS